MANIKITGNMKVKTLRTEFKKAFGSTLRVYNGSKFADDNATLSSLIKGNDKKSGTFAVDGHMKVGNFENAMMNTCGVKVQVASKDDSKLVDNDLTLTQSGK
ncbi:hypothetical protein [Helicobacter cetorum]|uniref:hypothetical protein n=1 Tax=Helicobacter cetorum TaxID=138563 RepID=UPI000CF11001|nr:hypothetical protein [Helicobacter cetorum]